MKFTFGIITYADAGVNPLLKESVESIRSLKIPQYEVIIVGNQGVLDKEPDFQHSDIRLINFDESHREKWITRKKNIITDNASFENIVYQHDYLIYDSEWYNGYLKFGDNFNICINKITNPKAFKEIDTKEGEENRFRDLVIDMWSYGSALVKLGIDKRACLIPYEEYDSRLSKYMYISGTYWVGKKTFMKRCRLAENLCWGQGEDVEFSNRARKITKFEFNPHSIVKLNKPGARIFSLMTTDDIRKFKRSVSII